MNILNMKIREARMFDGSLVLKINNSDVELGAGNHLVTVKANDFSEAYYDFMDKNRELLGSYLNVRVSLVNDRNTLEQLLSDCLEVIDALDLIGLSAMWNSEKPKINLLIFDLDSLAVDNKSKEALVNIMGMAYKVGIIGIFIAKEESIRGLGSSIETYTAIL